ncbi:stalk domain-containing protein [Paenibacillus piri]|uniref:Copper amine oxidase N-terminal domain-containing protein n=1 Tax=Paenibacillus piri TaxID=2547395 RepID=A0A4R5KJU0_9BACL|nr:stalk domain-containing protein [Paenibacillus piri]TDF95098.1 hypothetical protein E1757_21420 [Paenibacillus piri]
MLKLGRLFTVCIVLIAMLFAGAGSPIHAEESKVSFYRPFPQGAVGVTRPMIGILFELKGNPELESYKLNLDGKQVSLTWNPVDPKFVYIPDKDLTPGEHKAELIIHFKGFREIYRSWTFTIAASPVKTIAQPAQYQQFGITAINDFRKILGLQSVQWNDRLAGSATKHVEYLKANYPDDYKGSYPLSHYQESDGAGFFGKTPAERAKYFGYPYFTGEVNRIRGNNTIWTDIDNLFHAPYHRFAYMVPDAKEVGLARSENFTVINFGGSPDSRVNPLMIVSPAESQTHVPIQWENRETPDPLRMHANAPKIVGYPIAVTVHGTYVKRIDVASAELASSTGDQVELYVNRPGQDENLSTEAVFIPKKPLQAFTMYTMNVKLKVTMEDDTIVPLDKEWSFSTEKKKNYWKSAVHKGTTHTAVFGLENDYFDADGIRFKTSVKPETVDGSAYLYVRDLAVAFGADVAWDNKLQAAIYERGERRIVLYTTRNQYEADGQVNMTDTPAKLIHDNTMIPVRLLAEVLGSTVAYDPNTRTVTVTFE